MKTKIFWAALAIAAAAICTSCSHSGQKANSSASSDVEETTLNETEETAIGNEQIPDVEILDRVLHAMSNKAVIYNHYGHLVNASSKQGELEFIRGDHIAHYRLLLPKEDGGFKVGYMTKTTRGVSIYANKVFYFYNELCLSERIHSICSVVGMERSDGKLIPMKILVDGKENPIMKDCKDSDVLRFVPLYGNSDIELKYTVRELKEYCEKNGLPARAVPFLHFTD
ncbi:MAG: hypothetical protein OSJ76_00115 [Alphaproteobacteria bacterium]|nr:hypothetical protein [Alphaproteobacteria bacterium]